VLHEAIRREGAAELHRPIGALAWSALAAGLSMGFSLVGEGLLRAHLPRAQWAPLIVHFGYTLGFLFVIGARQQLFTEDTLLAVIPLLSQRDRETLARVLRLWTIVLFGNLAGALLFAAVVARVSIFDAQTQAAFADIGGEAMAASAAVTFVRAIFAGWVIALMVWIIPSAPQSRVAVVIIMTYVVALGGFAHVIAGSAETLFQVLRGQVEVGRWMVHWFLPTLTGNVIGGVTLVAAVNHAQVVTGED
jgi:formate/nitrite transporter FocA (FNT family)